ncbi:hypothetical protein DESA109040_15715 [Deinococcus saxicola]
MDAFAAQHPGNAAEERRQRGSVAVHLVILCAHFEHGVHPDDLLRLRSTVSQTLLPRLGFQDWPALPPPAAWGELNAPALANIPGEFLVEKTDEWARQVWDAWAKLEPPVRHWTQTLLKAQQGRDD